MGERSQQLRRELRAAAAESSIALQAAQEASATAAVLLHVQSLCEVQQSTISDVQMGLQKASQEWQEAEEFADRLAFASLRAVAFSDRLPLAESAQQALSEL